MVAFVLTVLNGVASVLTVLGFVLDGAERFAAWRERKRNDRR